MPTYTYTGNTVVVPGPTDEQIKEYAGRLPPIYRSVLAVYPTAAPNRRAEDPLSLGTLEDGVVTGDPTARVADVERAVHKLTDRGFLASVADGIAYAPTPLGERLITAVTGHWPVTDDIPDLPDPTWG